LVTGGNASFTSSRRLGANCGELWLSPVMLAPGRLMLATSPVSTGSPLFVITMGIDVVVALAASMARVPPAMMTSTLAATNCLAIAGSSASTCVERMSRRMFLPSM
jgi:hypothetical protein